MLGQAVLHPLCTYSCTHFAAMAEAVRMGKEGTEIDSEPWITQIPLMGISLPESIPKESKTLFYFKAGPFMPSQFSALN